MIIGRSVGLNKQPSRQQFILLIYVLTVQPFFSQLSSASDCKCVHCFQAICMYPASKALHFHVGRMWPACDRRRAKCGPHGIARLCCLGRKFNDIGQLLLAGPGMVFYPQITSLENVFFLFFFFTQVLTLRTKHWCQSAKKICERENLQLQLCIAQ